MTSQANEARIAKNIERNYRRADHKANQLTIETIGLSTRTVAELAYAIGVSEKATYWHGQAAKLAGDKTVSKRHFEAACCHRSEKAEFEAKLAKLNK